MPRVLLLALSILFSGAVQASALQSDLFRSFLQNAPPAYERLQASFEERIVGSAQIHGFVYSVASPEHKGMPTDSTVSIKAKKGRVIVEMPSPYGDGETSPGGVTVLGANEKYLFQLSRNGGGPWLVDDLQANRTAAKNEGVPPVFDAKQYLRLSFPFALPGTTRSLSELMISKSFKVISSTVDAEGLLEVDFVIDEAPEFNLENMFSSLRSGHLVVDPENNWRLVKRSTVVAHKNGGQLTTEVTYDYQSLNLTTADLPSSTIAKVFYPGGAVSQSVFSN